MLLLWPRSKQRAGPFVLNQQWTVYCDHNNVDECDDSGEMFHNPQSCELKRLSAVPVTGWRTLSFTSVHFPTLALRSISKSERAKKLHMRVKCLDNDF